MTDKSQTIGFNYLTSDTPLWFTLADVIASKLLTGKVPKIIEAITFSPKEPQSGLKTVMIAGNPDYQVDPANDDFFKRLIDLRTTVKARLKNATALNRDALDSEQQALKILANSTSYGIFVEINVADLDDPRKADLLRTRRRRFSSRNSTRWRSPADSSTRCWRH